MSDPLFSVGYVALCHQSSGAGEENGLPPSPCHVPSWDRESIYRGTCEADGIRGSSLGDSMLKPRPCGSLALRPGLCHHKGLCVTDSAGCRQRAGIR